MKAVWHPTDALMKSTRLYRWMRELGFDDYDTFFQATVEDIRWFWGEAEKALGIQWFKRYEKVLDLSRGIQWPDWFVGGKLNGAYEAVDKWLGHPEYAARTAIVWEGEDGDVRSWTYRELSERVSLVAGGLQTQGVRKGDRLALYLPMIPETVVALLAAMKIGAVVVPCFSGFKGDAVAKRLASAQARFMITADGFYRRGKPIMLKEEADRACAIAGCVDKQIVVRRLNCDISWQPNKDIAWETLESSGQKMTTAAPMQSGDPFMIMYTSGTTGRPKGAVHTHSGFPIKAAFDAGFSMDVQHGDTMMWVTDMGWMMGPFLIFASLLNAATMVLYEGSPDYPGPDRVWVLVAKHRITHLGISPTLIRSLMPHGESIALRHDLSSLKGIGSTGEPWNPEPWHWLFEKVGKKRLPIFNYSGGTEISGGILGNVPLKPMAPISFNSPLPGMDADVYDESGQPVRGEVGELVIRQPWVGMTSGFWEEPERYEETYWSRWHDTWVHGDWAVRSEDGFWMITGRSDDTLNIAGKRIGPTEIESVLVDHPAVREAGVIGVPDDLKGEVAVCFVCLNPGHEPSETLRRALVQFVGDHLGKALRPQTAHFVTDLPKTRNQKIMRRAIRAAYLGNDPGDLSALDNPEAVEAIRQLANKVQ